MHTENSLPTGLSRLSAACAGLLLAACAGAGPQQAGAAFAPAPRPAPTPAAMRSADGYYALGRKQHGARRDAEAQRAYQLALQLDPGHVNAGNGLAVLAAGQGDYPRAIALWQELTARGAPAPHSAFLFGNLGYAYFLSGDKRRALAALEQACVLDPRNARSWEHLGAVLEQLGQGERAALVLAQARRLRQHAAGADYALPGRAGGAAGPGADADAATAAAAAPAEPAGTWPDAMPRTELVANGGMLELRRVAAPVPVAAAPAPRAAPAAPDAPGAPDLPSDGVPLPLAPLRLEIRNGNGVAGMAAALGRTLASGQLRVTRLGNEASFQVARSRIEYRPGMAAQAQALAARLGPLLLQQQDHCTAADLRVVLGRDLRDASALQRRYARQAKLARLEPPKVG